MAPVHPGEILLEEFLKPLGVSQYRLAKEIGVPARRINEIVHGHAHGVRAAGHSGQLTCPEQLGPEGDADIAGPTSQVPLLQA
jgi:hypothetical protein